MVAIGSGLDVVGHLTIHCDLIALNLIEVERWNVQPVVVGALLLLYIRLREDELFCLLIFQLTVAGVRIEHGATYELFCIRRSFLLRVLIKSKLERGIFPVGLPIFLLFQLLFLTIDGLLDIINGL